MTIEQSVAQHYTRGDLAQAIFAALERAGIAVERIDPDQLAPVDEMHTGGWQATVDFAEQLAMPAGAHLLDVGSGVGGPARYFARHRGCRVTGIDLTEEHVRVAKELTRRTGLGKTVEFHQGSALALPFAPATFDGAYMLHVGMNIADKATLFGEVRRVLKPGGGFGLFDIMRTGEGAPAFPLPWAQTPETSFLAAPAAYRRLLAEAGFALLKERGRRAFAIDFFRNLQARAAAGGPPPLSPQMIMGAEFGQKIANLVDGIERGVIEPTEMICRAA
jgi:SAM-dependent methyltransferase